MNFFNDLILILDFVFCWHRVSCSPVWRQTLASQSQLWTPHPTAFDLQVLGLWKYTHNFSFLLLVLLSSCSLLYIQNANLLLHNSLQTLSLSTNAASSSFAVLLTTGDSAIWDNHFSTFFLFASWLNCYFTPEKQCTKISKCR